VAVLGGGIMGCATAIALTRRGVDVTLFDAADRLLARASRWNEGKIHLGYLYAGDPSLATAQRLLPGGLAFRRLIQTLLGESIGPAIGDDDEIYLVHRQSVAGAAATVRYLDAVASLVRAHPEVAGSVAPEAGRAPDALSPADLARLTDSPEIVAGFRVAERSVSTTWIADRLEAVALDTPRLRLRLGARVTGVAAVSDRDDRLRVETTDDRDGPYDAVVNALWEGRLAVDQSVGLVPPAEISHRYRVAAFVRLTHPIDVPSAVIGTGPFGDAKRFGDRDVYLSWYPAGLLAESDAPAPAGDPRGSADDEARVLHEILTRLGDVLPAVRQVPAAIDHARIRGGWVYASGRGSLAHPASTLHRRDRVGIQRAGRYLSVDTGKYSLAPWLAQQVADQLV
jgi:glycine/D-amino acid oxidase-like deaminating enzyme